VKKILDLFNFAKNQLLKGSVKVLQSLVAPLRFTHNIE